MAATAMVISRKYEVVGSLGQGGMGVVYKVRHTHLETISALKVLPAYLMENQDMVNRFYREARVMARLNHPNIVRVLDIEREISSVAAGSTGSLTPTISQRRVKSSIAVASGQTVLLAGLISESENRQRQGIPILDSIPGFGDAFSHQTNARARTELILFIRPTMVKDAVDASVIAEEMRTKMNSRLVGTSNPVVVVDTPRTAR